MITQAFARIGKNALLLSLPLLGGLMLLVGALAALQATVPTVYADPIPPPDGYPKLTHSSKTVSPTLANVGGETLFYTIEISNTGAYTAFGATMVDAIPANTTYNGDAWSSVDPQPTFAGGQVQWQGDVGFDDSVLITFTVDVDVAYEGTVDNTAVINHDLIAEPVSVTAESAITDDPLLVIGKTAEPGIPGANQPMTYTLVITNLGQTATNLPVTVVDNVPVNTTFSDVGPDGSYAAGVVTWDRNVTLATGDTSEFYFVVDVSDVPSGTVITNDTYSVDSTPTGIVAGDVYTTTVLDPILLIFKEISPDPPGSNSELTYTLNILNRGSRATGLVITDVVPSGVTYVSGGDDYNSTTGVVTWNIPVLETDDIVEVFFVGYVDDVAEVELVNSEYGVCAGDVCQPGATLTSTVAGPTFVVTSELDPIAKKPGGGGGPVTPTLTVINIGPGNALDATALLKFGRISVSANDFTVIPNVGTVSPGPDCGSQCVSFKWIGDISVGEMITFTTLEGQSTIGGAEGTNYTATIVVTDTLGAYTTEPITATAVGTVTHYANLIPIKSAPETIGPGQLLTYTIRVWNSALTTDTPPFPYLTDTVPLSTTFVSASDGGVSMTVGASTVISWTLPDMSTSEELYRTFVVKVDEDLVSGTLLFNDDYGVTWWEDQLSDFLTNMGQTVTTTVREVGLIDSFKTVTPTLSLPGPDNVLTYVLHIVNSSPVSLTDVVVYDYLPWADSTYQRDAIATSGTVVSDIVSVEWTGNVAAYSEELVTMTIRVDPWFEGTITNTMVITDDSLQQPVTRTAVAYITDDPVLQIYKTASPDPVESGEELLYTIFVTNLGQRATELFITDTLPSNGDYVAGSATGGGTLVGDQVQWTIPILETGETKSVTFRVSVGGGQVIVNEFYGVTTYEGISAVGPPVTTTIRGGAVYLPVIIKN